MKGGTNIQVNGDVYVNVHCDCSPQRHEQSAEWGAIAAFAAGKLLHGVGNLILGVGWLVVMTLRVTVWTAARLSSGVLHVERQLGGGPTRLVSLGPGERVNETTEMTRYVE